jgi:hypothetical protein
LVAAVVSTLLAAVLVAVTTLAALLCYDPHPLTSDLTGRAHGRVEAGMVLLRAVLVAVVQIAGPQIGPWPVIGVLSAAGVAWVAMHAYFMPFTHHAMNVCNLAVGMLFSYMCAALVAAQASPTFDAAIAVYLAAPFALACGLLVAHLRRAWLLQRPVFALTSAYEVELQAR